MHRGSAKRNILGVAWACAVLVGCGGAQQAAGPDGAADGGSDGPADAGNGSVSSVACELRRAPKRVQWHDDAVFYEIFVRSFADGDGDGIGDFAGLIERLDYLNDNRADTTSDLGVTGIWLMPTFPAFSYHGYDVTDYRTVNPEYGDDATFARFLDEAHARGIRVILDLVLNHTSFRHPWFVDATSGPEAAYRSWYVWSDTSLNWNPPWGSGRTWHENAGAYYYAVFWFGMPDLNYTHEPVRNEAADIARFWLGRGVDGFRLDAVRYLIETGQGAGQQDTAETHAFWKWFRAEVAAAAPDALLVGEAWDDDQPELVTAYLGANDELHMTFDFPLRTAILDGILREEGAPLATALCAQPAVFPDGASDALFTSNHDLTRTPTLLAEDAASLRLEAALLLTLPGTPFLYYGQEIGMPNGAGDRDEAKRLPMWWEPGPLVGFSDGASAWQAPLEGSAGRTVADQTGDPASLLSLYRDLIRLRRAHPALARGDGAVVGTRTADGPAPLVLTRVAGGERLVVMHNLADVPARGVVADLSGLAGLPASGRLVPLWDGGAGLADLPLSPSPAAVALGDLPARGSAVLAIEAAP